MWGIENLTLKKPCGRTGSCWISKTINTGLSPLKSCEMTQGEGSVGLEMKFSKPRDGYCSSHHIFREWIGTVLYGYPKIPTNPQKVSTTSSWKKKEILWVLQMGSLHQSSLKLINSSDFLEKFDQKIVILAPCLRPVLRYI